jgi:hypothetical protein
MSIIRSYVSPFDMHSLDQRQSLIDVCKLAVIVYASDREGASSFAIRFFIFGEPWAEISLLDVT